MIDQSGSDPGHPERDAAARPPRMVRTRRSVIRLGAGAFGAGVLLEAFTRPAAGATAFAALQDETDLTAEVRIFETTTTHNRFPDDCDQRLERLYIAEEVTLGIEVQFSRELSDDEARLVQWQVTNGAANPASGDFAGLPNPALIMTMVAAGERSANRLGDVRITYQGVDVATPAPLRVVSNQEYDAAFATLAAFTSFGNGSGDRLPLTADLLARFLGQDSTLAGTPAVGTTQLDICDPRLTHRAGANWGNDTVTDVPLVQYDADQPASTVVAEATARALLALHAEDISQFFVENPGASTYDVDFQYTGNLTLTRPADAGLALHGVQFDGTVGASVEAPARRGAALTARQVQVAGTVGDLYDFNIEASGAGAFPATEAAKVEIASVKHDVGKVFVVSLTLDASFDELLAVSC
jgi:hypothetical protein